jgi:hypothetical protein
MAFTAVASVIAGTATTATVVAAVGEIGLAMSAVGAVTGNQDLMKIGGVMGIAGGLGSLAMSAGSAAEGAVGGLDIGSGGVGQAADLSGSSSGAVGNAVTSSVADPMQGITDVTDSFAQTNSPSQGILSSQAPDQTPVDASSQNGASGYDVGNGVPTPSAQPAPSSADASQTAQSNIDPTTQIVSTAPKTTAAPDVMSQSVPIPGATTSAESTDSFFAKLGKWATENKDLANGIGKLGAGALQGAGTAYDANRKFALGEGALALQQKQASNANSVPTITNIPGLPQTPTPYMGILSGARG